MSSTVLKESRSQQTLQSYLDALLQDAVIGLAESVSADEFQAAVLEEQQRDTQRVVALRPVAPPEPEAVAVPVIVEAQPLLELDRKSTRLNSSHMSESRMPSSA